MAAFARAGGGGAMPGHSTEIAAGNRVTAVQPTTPDRSFYFIPNIAAHSGDYGQHGAAPDHSENIVADARTRSDIEKTRIDDYMRRARRHWWRGNGGWRRRSTGDSNIGKVAADHCIPAVDPAPARRCIDLIPDATAINANYRQDCGALDDCKDIVTGARTRSNIEIACIDDQVRRPLRDVSDASAQIWRRQFAGKA